MKVLFDHLQKTGGTALLAFFGSHLGESKVSPLILHEDIRFAAGLLDRFVVVGGHLDLGPGYDWDASIYHVTVLRDPIERFLSHYSYSREQPDATDPFAVLARRHDIATLLRLGDKDVLRTAGNFYIRHFAHAFSVHAPMAPAELLTAMERRYSLIGISERMDDVARMICVALGLDAGGTVRPVRVTQNRLRQTDLDRETLALLRELTSGDHELYQLAAARFATIRICE